ncbi:hypothetical protein [Dethiobacter alkaliphilus]|uniref:Uncharacterized protein n=1 Tax=Dethiobacter alkaliphilus AHT 1 TaxID=555088 RepID=C0GHR4_DETAL|nr:hypothetical protein [Dethiobacter alkaliphilus]EEG77270.1 conserved hypothetical protein [Dethiobacter alkaliphilus AHT 1]
MRKVKSSTTSWVITGLGTVVTGIGKMLGGKIGAAIAGFGLAHVVLGMLDRIRPTVRQRS